MLTLSLNLAQAEEDAAVSSELTAVLEDLSAPLADRRAAADRAGALHFVSEALRETLASVLADRSTDGQLRMLAAYSLGRCGAVEELAVRFQRHFLGTFSYLGHHF